MIDMVGSFIFFPYVSLPWFFSSSSSSIIPTIPFFVFTRLGQKDCRNQYE